MHYFQLSPLSLLAGLVAVGLVACLRFYYAFRYQYLCLLFKKRPSVTKKLLERSYLKNRSIVGLLDKSTKEILNGDYDSAEQFIVKGIHIARERKNLQSKLVAMLFYNQLSWILYYRGQYNESLQVAINLYERSTRSPAILALISCNFARLGDIQRSVEAYSKLSGMKKATSSILLPCKAEIEAAKGNTEKAVNLLAEAQQAKKKVSIPFVMEEIEKRINQLKKA